MKNSYWKRCLNMVKVSAEGLNIGMSSKARRQRLGFMGEVLAFKYLENLGHTVEYTGQYGVGYDLFAANKRIEVKTAQLNKRGSYQVSLSKKDHSDIKKSDVLIILCVGFAGKVTPLIIPTDEISENKQLTISAKFTGKLSQYVGNTNPIANITKFQNYP